MANFSVLVLTAPPPGQANEDGGAYVKIDGREALLRSIELFLNRDDIKQVLLVVDLEQLEEAKRKFGAHFGFAGVKLVPGGPKWMDQVAAAEKAVSPDASHVIIHDAARPAVPYSDIDAVLDVGQKHPAVGLAAPVRSTLVEVDEKGNPLHFHLAQHFMHLLTPQCFSRQKFAEMATSKIEISPSQVTIVKGSPLNHRIGGPGDAALIKTMINMLPKPKIKAPDSPFEEAQW